MNLSSEFIVCPGRHTQRGQSLIVVMFILVILLAAAALVIDVGQLYYSYQQLQASTQAAALAGGQAIPSGTAVATAGDGPQGGVLNVLPPPPLSQLR
jgi:Flp pilus assembly protein TadG